jgi:membrane protein
MARAGAETSVSFEWARRIPRTIWKLVTQTVGTCLRYRVTGLAAEAAFFAILSLPPLIFGLAGSIGFIASQYFEVETIDDIKLQIADLAGRALTDESVKEVIVPTLNQVLGGGRPDVISIGFVLALWSGSRALNVFVDTITIMYGMGGKRGIIKTRALSFSLYCAALVVGIVVLPLVLAGPGAVADLLPQRLDFLNQLYWPVVTILSAGFLNTLYHLSVPVRTPWVSDLPGSFLALSIWVLGSFILRWILQSTVGGTSIYGPLAAPIAVLMWLYMTAIAVLIGAALNAVVDRLWPTKSRREEAEHAPEPVMKAEAEPDETEDVPASEERPEARLARAAEALAEPAADAEMPEPAPAASAPDGLTALENAPSAAPGVTKPTPAVAPTAPAPASGDGQSDERPGKQDLGLKPAAVGKPHAQGDSDDIR